jgi:hypothetical protein
MLLASASKQTANQTWQLYQLLQSCQEAGSWPAAQQGLPAAVTSAVIEQQSYAAASSDRLLQLWDKQQQTEAGQKLTPAASTAVMSALVAFEQHAAALQMVAQQDVVLLVPLTELWQQQLPSTDVLVQALQQLCADSSQLGSAAADVAEQLVTLLEQQQALQQAVRAQPATAVQLVQLLSEQRKLVAALSLVSCLLDQASSTVVTPAMTVSLVNALAQQQFELQPAAAAVAVGLVSAEELTAAGADSISTDSTAISTDSIRASQIIAQLCYMQLPLQGVADVEELSDTVSVWVDKLSHAAAAAALFSTWYWSQTTNATGGVATAQTLQLPAASSIGVLGLSLYAAAPAGKPTLSSLLLDLALNAAADARDWDRGALATMLQAIVAYNSSSIQCMQQPGVWVRGSSCDCLGKSHLVSCLEWLQSAYSPSICVCCQWGYLHRAICDQPTSSSNC